MAKTKNRKDKIEIKELNNKSRKGKYVYIRLRNKKGKYFKLIEGVETDEYLKAYEGGIRKKRLGIKGTSEIKRKSISKIREIFINQIKNRRRLDDMIKKGITKSKYDDIKKIDRKKVKDTYKEMLKPLVKDEGILDIVTMNENIEKMKNRLVHILRFKDNDDIEVLRMRKAGVSIDTVAMDINQQIINNIFSRGGMIRLTEKGYILEGIDRDKLYNTRNAIKVSDEITFIKGK